jgi:hypothetical protein
MSVKFRAWVYVAIIGFAMGGATTTRAEGLLDRIMRVMGISATPSQMKGDSDVTAGQVWIADLERGSRTALTTESGYCWPVYEPSMEAVVALKGDSLVRIPVRKGEVKVVHKIPGVEKLVGFDREDPDQLLVVLDKDTAPLAVLSLNTGKLTPLPYDLKSKDDRRMLSHVKGEDRVYGIVRVYVKTLSKQSMEGTLEWGDVYLQQGEATPRDVSNCDGVTCGQPSLSPDGKAVVYIRAGE